MPRKPFYNNSRIRKVPKEAEMQEELDHRLHRKAQNEIWQYFVLQLQKKENDDYKHPPGNFSRRISLKVYLWKLLYGQSFSGMQKKFDIPKSTLLRLWKYVHYKLEKFSNDWLVSWNRQYRLDVSTALSPRPWNALTVRLDGTQCPADRDGSIGSRHDYYSFKMKRSGLNTLLAQLKNEWWIWASPSKPAATTGHDCNLFNEFHTSLMQNLDKFDRVVMDRCFKQEYRRAGFVFGFRNSKQYPLTPEQELMNDQICDQRRQIERSFSEFKEIFEIFGETTGGWESKTKYFNASFKNALALHNLHRVASENMLFPPNFAFSTIDESFFAMELDDDEERIAVGDVLRLHEDDNPPSQTELSSELDNLLHTEETQVDGLHLIMRAARSSRSSSSS